jgi:hypothetical protein
VADVNEESNTSEMLKVCQWYSAGEKEWLWDSIWNTSFYTHSICNVFGILAAILLGISSCYHVQPQFFKMLAMSFGIMAILNVIPFLIYWKSEMCSVDQPICNENQSNCVDSCQIGSGSWQLFATSFMWLSSMISTWGMLPITKTESSKDVESQINEIDWNPSRTSTFSSGDSSGGDDGPTEKNLDHTKAIQGERTNP